MVSRLFNHAAGYISKCSSSTLVLCLFGLFILIINPLAGIFRPCCLIREMTGFYCSGCGMTTGLYSLFRGNFHKAAERNILIFTVIPAALFYLILRKIIISFTDRYKTIYDIIVITFFIILVVIFTICRNINIPEFDVLRPH